MHVSYGIASRRSWSVLGILLLAFAPAGASAKEWTTDFDKASAEAQRKQRPLLVHFYADWCGPCRQMEQTVLNDREVLKALDDSVVAVKVNSDHRPDLVSRFGVSGLPSDVILAPDGSVITRSSGANSKSGYLAQINSAAARFPGESRRERRNAVIVATLPGTVEGLAGYSPVSLTSDRNWKKGRREFGWMHDGVVYYMSSAEELREFKQNAERYVPQLLGCDPVVYAKTREAIPGDIRFGAFFEGTLFLLASDQNRRDFMRDPLRFITSTTATPTVSDIHPVSTK